MIKKYFSYLLFACCAALLISGCKKDEEVTATEEGIVFSPLAPYQEAYPGTIVTFKFRVNTPEAISSFKVQFKQPGATTFVDMPEYPEVTTNTEMYRGFQDFEYALPPATTAVNQEMNFKLTVKTTTKTFEKIYTVKMLSTGVQTLRIYNPTIATYFRAQSIDLLNASIVPDNFPATTKDMVAFTLKSGLPNVDSFLILRGFQTSNTTRYKVKTKAIYDAAPSTYAAAYTAGTESTGANNYLVTATATISLLNASNNYFLAKVARGTVITYVGIFVKKLPAMGFTYNPTTGEVYFTNEYIEIQIKK